MEENQKQWFVIHTYSGYEERVKKNLEQRIKSMDSGDVFQVVIPTAEETEVKNGQRREVTKKILPGYVLIQMRMSDQSWNIVSNTPGVTGFVGGVLVIKVNDLSSKTVISAGIIDPVWAEVRSLYSLQKAIILIPC